MYYEERLAFLYIMYYEYEERLALCQLHKLCYGNCLFHIPSNKQFFYTRACRVIIIGISYALRMPNCSTVAWNCCWKYQRFIVYSTKLKIYYMAYLDNSHLN